ncbi:MAG TPA: hypothetical protein VHL80_13210 [Polyangia bacterium]|nr:hypothetical protein [Polyangia bacterium]
MTGAGPAPRGTRALVRAWLAGGVIAMSLLARAAAGEGSDGGAAGPDGAAADAPGDAGAAEAPPPGSRVTPAPPSPAARATERALTADEQAQRTRGRWPLAYVDRPQTLLAGMNEFSAATRDDFGGPAGYRRLLLGLSYGMAPTDWFELWGALPFIYCAGGEAGACTSTLQPELGLVAALVRGPRAKLALGASIFDIDHSATAWTRLKLVAVHRASFELEPSVVIGIRDLRTPAWWNPSVTQDANQSRAFLTLDANVQLTEQLLAWADAVPYVPVAGFGGAFDAAVEVLGGVTFSFTKAFQLSTACGSLNALSARRWEYVPDVRLCRLTFVARSFGPGPSGVVTVPVPQPLY